LTRSASGNLTGMFNVGQRAAVVAAFKLAGVWRRPRCGTDRWWDWTCLAPTHTSDCQTAQPWSRSWRSYSDGRFGSPNEALSGVNRCRSS